MFSFKAYFWNNTVFINGKHKYAVNEILSAYLNTTHLKLAEEYLSTLKILRDKLILTDDMEYYNEVKYNINVYSALEIFERINGWMQKLPPYNRMFKAPFTTLEDVLNKHTYFYLDGLEGERYNFRISWNTVTKYGCGEQLPNGAWKIRIHKFYPTNFREEDLFKPHIRDDLQELNEDISNFFNGYISFLKSYISIQTTYKTFIKDYLHRKETFATENETAQCFTDFNKENGNALNKIECKMKSFGYKVLTDENKKPILCEEIKFSDLQSFIYYDFFYGIKRKYIPNKCKHCGKYFLIHSGKYTSYCDRTLKNEKNKTCRDVGAKRRYDDKCKNDPIWQTYNRAYKAHYARLMKKKMTTSEFEQWSRYAIELRDKALAGKLEFEQYYTNIRK